MAEPGAASREPRIHLVPIDALPQPPWSLLLLAGLLLRALTWLLAGLLLAGILLLLSGISLALSRLLLLARVLLLLAGIGRLIAGLAGVLTLVHWKPLSIAGAKTLRSQGRHVSTTRR